MAKKRYRMTPARRAALKRAQAASARKRRGRAFKSGLKAVGSGAALVGGTFAVYHGNRYIARPDHAVKEIGIATKALKKGVIATNRKIRGGSDLKRSVKAAKKATNWSKFGYL